MSLSRIDTSNELIIQRYLNGFKLVSPISNRYKSEASDTPHGTLGNLLQQRSFNVFLTDDNGVAQSANESEAYLLGFDSVQHFIGKNVFDVAPESIAQVIRCNDLVVMNRQRGCIYEEQFFIPKTEISLQFLCFKFPWYHLDNTLIGIFGLSIAMGVQGVAQSLTDISALGLLKPLSASDPEVLLSYVNGIYLTKREIEILRYTVRGYTAKKISLMLQISSRTIEQHIANVKNKLGVSNKSELIDMLVDKFFS